MAGLGVHTHTRSTHTYTTASIRFQVDAFFGGPYNFGKVFRRQCVPQRECVPLLWTDGCLWVAHNLGYLLKRIVTERIKALT